ncbi:hypothetical protein ABZP36_008572 [Zizania latifolia]
MSAGAAEVTSSWRMAAERRHATPDVRDEQDGGHPFFTGAMALLLLEEENCVVASQISMPWEIACLLELLLQSRQTAEQALGWPAWACAGRALGADGVHSVRTQRAVTAPSERRQQRADPRAAAPDLRRSGGAEST